MLIHIIHLNDPYQIMYSSSTRWSVHRKDGSCIRENLTELEAIKLKNKLYDLKKGN